MSKIVQFGFQKLNAEERHAMEYQMNMVDCRVIVNPYKRGTSEEELKAKVRANPKFEMLVQAALQLLTDHGNVYIGCAYGVHRSGAVAEEVAKRSGAEIFRLTE